MKQGVMLAVVLAASPAAAQPAMARENCAVTVLRAPDDVRAVVEQWVAAEPKCNVKLEIRIVPTDGGLYLLARDESGRVRERVVPDAQSAGVLVASWVAADSLAAPTPYEVRKPELAAPATLGNEGLLAPGESSAPGAMPVIAATPKPPRARWLSLGALAAMSGTGGGGIRAEWDLKTRGAMTFGLATSASTSGMMVYGQTWEDSGKLETFDGKLLGYAGLDGQRGRVHLRGTVGAGLVFTEAMLDQPSMYSEASGVFPMAEATATVGYELGSNWAFSLGPIISVYVQKYQMESTSAGYYSSTTLRRDLEATMFITMRYRL
ncbi:MAG TPA: hypothetical protein VIV40_00655 [Kofleriaceae bacterium]